MSDPNKKSCGCGANCKCGAACKCGANCACAKAAKAGS
jgi:hypothetical protein